jgi:hypothetical protein
MVIYTIGREFGFVEQSGISGLSALMFGLWSFRFFLKGLGLNFAVSRRSLVFRFSVMGWALMLCFSS